MWVFWFFIFLDIVFVAANSIKFLEGGYIPIALWCLIFIITGTWAWGRKVIKIARIEFSKHRNIDWLLDLKKRTEQAEGILSDNAKMRDFVITDRAVVFLNPYHVKSVEDSVPANMRVYMKSRGSLPKNIIMLNVEQTHKPYILEEDKYKTVEFWDGVYSVKARYGYMEKFNTLKVLKYIYSKELFDDKFLRCTLEVSEEEFVVDREVSLKYKILIAIFRFLWKNSVPRYKYFWFASSVTPGISKTIIPILVKREWVKIVVPEYVFEDDPKLHTRETEVVESKTIRFRDIWGT